jgi:hypothetical protein
MEPVISPWVFYLIDTVSSLRATLLVVPPILVILTAVLCMISCDVNDGENEKDVAIRARAKRRLVLSLTLGGAAFFVGLIMPSQSTAYKMLIAQQITVDRVEKGSQAIEKIYNDILKRVDKALDKKD